MSSIIYEWIEEPSTHHKILHCNFFSLACLNEQSCFNTNVVVKSHLLV